MSRAPVTIVMTTYFPPGPDGALRAQTAIETITTWKKYLHYDGEIRLHIADDGSDIEHEALFRDFVEGWADSASRQERHGVGASMNAGVTAALQVSGLWATFVDDWTLTGDFDLTPWADLLIDDETVGMVCFFPHPWLTGTIQTFPSGWGMKLDKHHFSYGFRPAIYHRRFTDHYGAFLEDVNSFDAEIDYNERCKGDGPAIVLALPSPWLPIDGVQLSHIDPSAR